MKLKLERIIESLHSPQGKNAMTFFAFLVVSVILWIVMCLNEETQRDLRCTVAIENVPDSLTRISPIPEAINVSVRAKGTDLIKYFWSRTPRMTIDYKLYKSGGKIQFSEASLKAFFRSMVGGGAQILSVSPDSLSILFTSQPGVRLPVRLNAQITAAPQFMIVGKNHSLIDSVTLYSANGVSPSLKYINTQPLRLTDVKKSQIVKVPLAVPEKSRAIPDSVEVSIEVEPLISKTRRVAVTPINVPSDLKLILVPSQVEIYYMVPMNVYKKTDTDPKFRVEADYNAIRNSQSDRIPVNLVYAPKDFTNVFLSTDSLDYIIEQK